MLDGKYKSVYGHSYGEAKAKLEAYMSKRAAPPTKAIAKGRMILWAASCEEWLDQKKLCLKQSSFVQYSCIVRKHILPYWGQRNANELISASVNSFVKALSERLSAKTVRDILSVFLQVVRFAEKKHGIHIDHEEISRPKAQTGNLSVLSHDEQRRLSCFLQVNPNRINAGILLLLYTGIRIGELCALQWQDIDQTAGMVSVTKTIQRIADPDPDSKAKTRVIIDTPKSRNSVRLVPIPSFLIGLLSNIRAKPDSYFLTGESKPMEPRLFQTKFKKALEQAKVTETNAHALRHTFATRAIEQNMDVKSLCEILGHATVKFTLERYVHSSTELKRSGMERLAVYL
ncbi:MAG: site-specific integrase [Oscillospiraceae bacterium]|nr:site-specific integrase [Oscillospiraceae bacterium]